ncbi:MAG: hypothetical protein Kow00124_19330 [Anaerolineae bacterium]
MAEKSHEAGAGSPQSPHHTRHTGMIGPLAGAVVILLAAFALRLYRLENSSVWWDEGFTAWIASLPIRTMLFETAIDVHPPLYYAILHGWMGLAGREEFALRLPSAFAGLLTAAVGYRLAGELGGKRAAAAAGLLIGLSRLQVGGAQEMRMHIFSALLALLTAWLTWRLFQMKRDTWRLALLVALSTAAGLLTVYLFAVVVLALNLSFTYAFFASRHRLKLAAAWGASQAGALLMVLPWLLYTTQTTPFAGAREALDALFVGKVYLSSLLLGFALDLDRYLPLLIAFLIVLAAAAVLTYAAREKRPAWAMLTIAVVLPPLLIYILYALPRAERFNSPAPAPRYFLILSGLVYVLIGWGAAALERRRRWSGLVILAGLLSVFVWSLPGYYQGRHLADEYSSPLAVVEALREPGDVLLLHDDVDWPVFAYHYGRLADFTIKNALPVRDEADAAARLAPIIEGAGGVWVVQNRHSEVTDPQNHIIGWLQSRATAARRYSFPESSLWFFALAPLRGRQVLGDEAARWPAGFERREAPIAQDVSLAGYVQPEPEVWSGGLFTLGLGWQAEDRATAGQWWAAVKLLAADGVELSSMLFPISTTGQAWQYYAPVQVYVPPDAAGGPAQLVFVAGETWQPLGTVHIRPRREALESVTIPDTAVPLNIRYGESIVLRAAALPDVSSVQPGDQLPLTLYWRSEAPVMERYKVFVHLVGEEVNPASGTSIWGQQDQEPRGGLTPTTGWLPGQVIADEYLIPVQNDAPAGMYRLQVGLYLPLEQRRLEAAAADGTPLGNSVTIVELEIGN